MQSGSLQNITSDIMGPEDVQAQEMTDDPVFCSCVYLLGCQIYRIQVPALDLLTIPAQMQCKPKQEMWVGLEIAQVTDWLKAILNIMSSLQTLQQVVWGGGRSSG